MTLLSQLKEGTELPGLKKSITQADVNLYAEASRDFNPIHIDPEFAGKTRFGRTIAHGMLTLAYVSQMMTVAFGQSWFTGSKLSIRFKGPAFPGDTVTVSGKITKIEKSGNSSMVSCEVLCNNQKNEPIIVGETRVEVTNP